MSWPRGELTAVVGLIATTLVLIRGFILKPGEPTSQVSLQLGWIVALVGSGLILFGALIHQATTGSSRPRTAARGAVSLVGHRRHQGARSATTESLVMRSRSGTVRGISARHDRAKLRALTDAQVG